MDISSNGMDMHGSGFSRWIFGAVWSSHGSWRSLPDTYYDSRTHHRVGDLFLAEHQELTHPEQAAEIQLNAGCEVSLCSWAFFLSWASISYPTTRICYSIPGLKILVGFPHGGTGPGSKSVLCLCLVNRTPWEYLVSSGVC